MSQSNVEIVRRGFDAYHRRDYDAMMSDYGENVVYDTSHRGLGVFEGRAMVRKSPKPG